jgi:3-methyladenine DNA glycosylase AlkC
VSGLPVSVERLAELETGDVSRTHAEQMAMDMGQLAMCALGVPKTAVTALRREPFLGRMRAGGVLVHHLYGSDLPRVATTWRSDTMRGWAAFAVPLLHHSLPERIEAAIQYADDEHFAVREWSWLVVRAAVCDQPTEAIEVLEAFQTHSSHRVLRFCSEVTRPRSVWGPHIRRLKHEPQLADGLLNALVPSEFRYVQWSVANWLNDDATTSPSWVKHTCARWQSTYGASVAPLVRRAQRRLAPAITTTDPT